MRKVIIILFTLLSLVSCRIFIEPMPKSWEWGLKPRPLTGTRNFPETDTDYGKGFKAGCENALQASSKGWTDILKQTINPSMMANNPDWGNGYFDGNEQCTYILDWDVV